MNYRTYAVGVVAGGLEGPGTLWVSLQHPSFPASCGAAQRAPGRHNQPEKGNLGEAKPPQTPPLRKSYLRESRRVSAILSAHAYYSAYFCRCVLVVREE